VTVYHLEAAIAAAHAAAHTTEETDWALIVSLYDRLMALTPSPVVALNRAVAVAQRDGPASGIDELHAIADRARLERYPFYPAAIGELELRRGNHDTARLQFSTALTLARNPAERRFLEKRVEKCR
jgi:RNA polymerase sigma-70 factor (ECF subfamily)